MHRFYCSISPCTIAPPSLLVMSSSYVRTHTLRLRSVSSNTTTKPAVLGGSFGVFLTQLMRHTAATAAAAVLPLLRCINASVGPVRGSSREQGSKHLEVSQGIPHHRFKTTLKSKSQPQFIAESVELSNTDEKQLQNCQS